MEERERLKRLEQQRLERAREEDAQRHQLLMGISPTKGGKARRFGCCSTSHSAEREYESPSLGGSLEVDGGRRDAHAPRRGTVVPRDNGEGGSRESPRTYHTSPPSPIPEWNAVLDASVEREDGDRILSARQSMLLGSPQPLFPSPPSVSMTTSMSRSMLRSDDAPGSARGGTSRREEGSAGSAGVTQALKHSRNAFASWRLAFDQV